MAVLRDQPYGNQYFTVDLGTGGGGPLSSFSEVVLPDATIDVIEYRTGGDKESGSRKLAGLTHYNNVILRRGVIGSLDLYGWFNQVRNGDIGSARRTVVIALHSEDHASIALTWKLLRAWPIRYRFSNLEATGKDVLIEELVLAYERLEME